MPLRDSTGPMPLPVFRYQYKYRHPANNRYILVYFEPDYDDQSNKSPKISKYGTPVAGKSDAVWALFDDDDEDFQEEHVDDGEDFQKMIDSEDWQTDGEEIVVVK